ncbi:MAG: M42 family metallopeptidase [Clostridia bacterium]|nr:M42 family metallopeptidase [Clostridia bacterium]
MNIIKEIKQLSSLSGISGYEHRISQYLANKFKKYCDEVYIDSIGNVIALKRSEVGSGKVMLEAHIDEIGMMVKSIDDNGFVLITSVGGIDPRILYGNVVNVHGVRDFIGVIGAKPPHVMTDDEYSDVIDFDKLYIDVGMSAEEAKQNIPIGSPVTFDCLNTELESGYFASKSLDDRASVAILLDVLETIKDVDLGYDLYFCACVQEEVGLRGSLTAAYAVNPDVAIAIDVTHATTPDESKGTFKCGCGPVICKGPNIHKTLCNNFISCLNNASIPFEIEVESGNTGTDAWSIQTAKEGIPTLLLSLPLKYMHTPVETLNIKDCESVSSALVEFLKSYKRTGDMLC